MSVARRPSPRVRFRQEPGVWYPLDLTTWSLAHLVAHAEEVERPLLAEWAQVTVDGLDEWAAETIRQVGGEVSVNPHPDPNFGEGDWSFTSVTRSAPSNFDPVSVGPQALWTVYRQEEHELAFTDDECDRVLDLADDATDVWIDDDELVRPLRRDARGGAPRS